MLLKFNITHFGKWNFHLNLFENIIFVYPKLFFSWKKPTINTIEIQKQVKNTKLFYEHNFYVLCKLIRCFISITFLAFHKETS